MARSLIPIKELAVVAYLQAIIRQWTALVGGAALAAVQAVLSALGVPIPQEFWIGAVLLGLVIAQYRAWAEQRRTAEQFRATHDKNRSRVAIKDLLATAIETGEALYHQGSRAEAEQWATLTHQLLTDAFGKGEAQQFLSDSGLSFFFATNRDPEEQDVRNSIDGRLRRLTELMPRVDSLSVRPEFNLQDWRSPNSGVAREEDTEGEAKRTAWMTAVVGVIVATVLTVAVTLLLLR